jgi:hypothetical protein
MEGRIKEVKEFKTMDNAKSLFIHAAFNPENHFASVTGQAAVC